MRLTSPGPPRLTARMPAKTDEYFMHFHAAAKSQGLIRRPLAAARPLRFNLNIPSATTTFDSPKHWNMRRQEGEGVGWVDRQTGNIFTLKSIELLVQVLN